MVAPLHGISHAVSSFDAVIKLTTVIYSGGKAIIASGIRNHGTAAGVEEPIDPGISVKYTQLLIDGKFVDAASGRFPDRFGIVDQHFLAWKLSLDCLRVHMFVFLLFRENFPDVGPEDRGGDHPCS